MTHRPCGLTVAEMARLATEDVCPVPERVEGYWLGPASEWKRRALAAEAALARLHRMIRAT